MHRSYQYFVVAILSFCFRLNLDLTAETYNLMFKPEVFTAVRFRLESHKVSINVSIQENVATGARLAKDIKNCLELLTNGIDHRF